MHTNKPEYFLAIVNSALLHRGRNQVRVKIYKLMLYSHASNRRMHYVDEHVG
jgi:hypothetical protein